MIVRDSRDPRGRNEGAATPFTGLGGYSGSGMAGFAQTGPIANGRCPVCGVKMSESPKSAQRSCIKLKDNSWAAQRKRGRGGFRFGAGVMATG